MLIQEGGQEGEEDFGEEKKSHDHNIVWKKLKMKYTIINMVSRLTLLNQQKQKKKIRLFNLEYEQMHGRKQNQQNKQIFGKQIFK